MPKCRNATWQPGPTRILGTSNQPLLIIVPAPGLIGTLAHDNANKEDLAVGN